MHQKGNIKLVLATVGRKHLCLRCLMFCQVKVEKDDSKVNCQPTRTSMGIFEAMEKKLSSVKQEKMDINGLLHNKEQKNFSHKNNYYQGSTSGNKRPKSPPSSPSLRQSKLTEERFSPKKRPSVMYGCPRQEQAFHYDTPLYCAVPLRKSLNSADPSLSKNFSETQMNSLQALKEENFHQSVLTTIASFMSQHRKPPLSLVFYLLKDILLAKQSNCGTACFRILRQIQVLHPAVPAQMISQKITWEFIAMIVKLSKCTDNKFQSGGDSGLAVNASLALSFIISVMEEEVKMKTFSHVKTSAYRLLFVVKHASHIHDVAEWIGEAVKQHRVEQYDHGCGHNVCPVYLLQRILMLSLLVSERPEDCASRIADEMILVYSQMPSIELKTLFLQSMQSYLLRARLIEMVVGNCCPLAQIEQGNDGIPSGGLRHIIFVDFKRSPSAFNDDVMSSSDKVDYIASCEEFLMLLAYWLQSLIFCRKKSLQKNTSDSLRILSMDDIDVMMDIDQELVKLRERLENLCSPTELSPRSYKLLELMRSLKSFVQKLP